MTVSSIPAGAPVGSQAQGLDIGRYRELHGCLDGFERVFQSGTGEEAGTIVICRTNGSTTEAKLYHYGLVQTEDGLFIDKTGKKTDSLCSVIRRLGH